MEREILFKAIDEVDWVSLNAAEVGTWLKDLTSSNQEIRGHAYSRLEMQLAFRGSDSWEYGPLSELLKTEMPVYIVPFFIELLRDQKVKGKDVILELLQDLATYVQLDADNEIYRTRAQKVYDTVRQGIDVYRSLLTDSSPAVKMGATLLLEELGETI
jgi:hypothetical protein